jgi:transcriptional antiterminator RfaH
MIGEKTEQWYCLKAKIKREHFAAAVLRSRTDFQIFCPRVTITKNTVRGPKAFTEALFPGYLFCRFNFIDSSRLVKNSPDVTGIVSFGDRVPEIPDETIVELQAAFPFETVEVPPNRIQEGELAEIIRGCFQGETGCVTKIKESTDRVTLLIEFLGNYVNIELPTENLINSKPVSPGVSLGLQVSSIH